MSIEEKKQAWNDMRKKIKTIRDGLGMPVDSSIIETVIVLNLLGFSTSTSCGGHIRRATSGPYVVFESRKAREYAKQVRAFTANAPANQDVYIDSKFKRLRLKARTHSAFELHKLIAYLDRFYAHRHVSYNDQLIVQSMPLTYNCLKCQGADSALALNSHDKKKLLASNQAEMNAFTEFLKAEYFTSNQV